MYNLLKNCDLFKNLSNTEIEKICLNISSQTINYKKNQIIATEGDTCKKIGIVISGSIIIQNLLSNGEVSTIGQFGIGKMFGEVLLFGEQDHYPATIVANDNCEILYISNQQLISLFNENEKILHNFLNILTTRIYYLNNRIKLINQQSIRSKIAYYLAEQYRLTKQSTIKLPMSKEKLAEYLNIQRPSLSRELIHMKEEGLIDYNRSYIIIKNINDLEAYIK